MTPLKKKIFLIHGKGKQHGLGEESGGDLDTVSSNAFYGIWMEELVARRLDHDPVYGEDYEFDFVNYQEGLRHLDVHSDCDLYLPDFPIDALAPRLQMHRIRRRSAAEERTRFHDAIDNIRLAYRRRPGIYPESWKTVHNDVMNSVSKYLSEKKYYEITVARLYSELFYGAVRQIYTEGGVPSAIERVAGYLFGSTFRDLRETLADRLDSNLKRNVIDTIDQRNVEERLLLDESARSDYGRLYRLRDGPHLLNSLVESQSVITGTYFLLLKLEGTLEDSRKQRLLDWTNGVRDSITEHLGELEGLLDQILEANPDNENARLMNDRCRSLREFFRSFSLAHLKRDYQPQSDLFQVHVTEETDGRPVEELEVIFNVSRGPIELSPVDSPDARGQNVIVKTDERGYAGVLLHGVPEDGEFGVTATYDERNFLSFPKTLQLGEDYFEEHPDADSIELQLEDYLTDGDGAVKSDTRNLDQIEDGTEAAGERTTRVQQMMIRRHLRYLDDRNVSLIRIDDHHPYTPAILDTLEALKDEGLLESITLSSLPRGEHQPREDQLCGADLIHRQFLRDTEADNAGLAKLRRATHLQDLHIEEDDMALELSRLIGSRFSKVRMCRGLMGIDSERDYDSILRSTGWDEVIRRYQENLHRVLPRLGKTLHRLTFVEPPGSGCYEDAVGWSFLKHPLAYFFANEPQKERMLREDYAENGGRKITFHATLSPFCDPEKNEPNINVASAQNYLADRYDFDYLLYAYGSFLMSTRRVNQEGYDIDLSKLVSKIGTPSDGGHAGAATGAPAKNPNFPVDRFDSVSGDNFTEYLYYIAGIIEEHTGLDLHAVEEINPYQYEPGIQEALAELTDRVYRLALRGSDGIAKIGVARAVYTDSNEPDVGVPMAVAHLRDKCPDLDYIFYSKSSSSLIMRNVSDERLTLDLDRLARIIGTFQDGGHPRSARCKPRFHPEFPEEEFDYVNFENMREYVNYLGGHIQEHYDLNDQEITPPGSDPYEP